jgi:hypothetical protein
MKSSHKKRLLFALMGFSYLLLSYNYFGGWWNSSVGTVCILFFCYLIWGKNFLKFTGLQLDWGKIIKILGLTVVILISAYLVMGYIADKHHVVIKYTNWRNYYHDIFYILNEEIMLGALPLFAMVLRKIKPIIASLTLAIAFALIHFVFYKWIFNDRGNLSILTLATLFLIGFVRNSIILHTGHIGYSWALHFGWMAVMFGSLHLDIQTNLWLKEPVRFNHYLGSMEMLVLSVILAGLCCVVWVKKQSCRLQVAS